MTEQLPEDPGGRSVKFPSFSLPAAIERARALFDAERRNYARTARVFEVWKYSPKSSGARQALATLRAFGLVDTRGRGQEREARVSERAERIIDDAPDADEQKRAAALDAPWHEELWEEYKENWPPSDENIRDYVKWTLRIKMTSQEALAAAIQFKETVGYAGLASSSSKPPIVEKKTRIEVGSWVNWESGGQMHWSKPRQVTKIAEHEGERFAFVTNEDGSEGAFPMSQAVLENRSDETELMPPPPPPDGRMVEDRWSVSSGTVVLRAPENLTAADLKALDQYLAAWKLKFEHT